MKDQELLWGESGPALLVPLVRWVVVCLSHSGRGSATRKMTLN